MAIELKGGFSSESYASSLTQARGACVHLGFSSIWVGSCLWLPTVLLLQYLIGDQFGILAMCFIIAVAIYPYAVRPGEWPAFRHAIPDWGQYYHNTCAYHIEEPPVIAAKFTKHGYPPASLLCYHPHGILSWSFVLNGGFRKEFEPGLGLVMDALYNAPFFRWFVVEWTGIIRPSNKVMFKELMKKKKLIGLIPGGMEEATISKYGVDRVFLKSRKGFIKYALQFGYTLVPVYCFGECDTYYNIQGCWSFRFWLNSLRIPGVLAWGTWWCPILPKRAYLNTVFGKAIHIPLIENPTQEEIDEWHKIYIERLVALYDEYKHQFASSDRELEIW